MNIPSTMRWLLILLALAALVPATAHTQERGLADTLAITPAEMKYVADENRPGLKEVVLLGNPTRPGIYAMHVKLPAHAKIPPHFHAETWRVATIISGTLYYAFGNTFDTSKLKALGPGSVLSEPKDAAHFAMTQDEEVVIHIVGVGPTGTRAVKD